MKAAAIGFYFLAVLQLYAAFRSWWGRAKNECGCTDCNPVSTSRAANGVFYSLFAIPLLLGLLLPDVAMNSNLAAKKGVSLTGNKLPTSTVSDPLDTLFPHDEYSEDLAKLGKKLYKKDFISIGEKGFMEIISSMDFYMENFMGKKVDISGFVYRENDMKEDQFVVSQFAVQCCSADAAPYGLMVESAAGKELKKDTWVKITGILEKTNYNGNEITKIHASKIENSST